MWNFYDFIFLFHISYSNARYQGRTITEALSVSVFSFSFLVYFNRRHNRSFSSTFFLRLWKSYKMSFYEKKLKITVRLFNPVIWTVIFTDIWKKTFLKKNIFEKTVGYFDRLFRRLFSLTFYKKTFWKKNIFEITVGYFDRLF